jgi:O-antigen ligase
MAFTRTPLDWPLFIFFLWACTSLIWAPDNYLASLHLFSLISVVFLYYIIVLYVVNLTAYKTLVWGWLFVGLFYSSIAIIQYFGGLQLTPDPGVLESEYSRVSGLSGSPNSYARFMSLTAFLMLGLFQVSWMKKGFNRTAVSLCLFLSLLTIILTLSRSAFIGLLAGTVFFCIKYIKKISPAKIIIFTLVICVLILIGIYAGIGFEKRLSSMLTFYEDLAWSSRVQIWDAAWQAFSKTYGIGIGLGGLESEFYKYYVPITKKGDAPPLSHSLYLDILVHFGIMGIILFVWAGIRLFHFTMRSLKSIDTDMQKVLFAMASGLIGVLLSVSISGELLLLDIWLYVGLMVATALVGMQEKQ